MKEYIRMRVDADWVQLTFRKANKREKRAKVQGHIHGRHPLGRGYIKLYSRDPTTTNTKHGYNAITPKKGRYNA